MKDRQFTIQFADGKQYEALDNDDTIKTTPIKDYAIKLSAESVFAEIESGRLDKLVYTIKPMRTKKVRITITETIEMDYDEDISELVADIYWCDRECLRDKEDIGGDYKFEVVND